MREGAVLPRRSADIRAGDGEEDICGRTFQEIAKGISRESGLKGELTKIVRWQERFDIEVANAPDVDARLERMSSDGIGEIVGELQGLGLSYTCLIPADGSKACSGAEDESRGSPAARRRMDRATPRKRRQGTCDAVSPCASRSVARLH